VSPLSRLVVLDFSTLLPGPLASLLMADAGAEVIKVERPGIGDEMRSYSGNPTFDSACFSLLNRGKRSIALDLKEPAALERLRPLLARADVIIEQFRPGVMERLGLSYASVTALNPRVIYCSITGYGQTGPSRNQAGHDLTYLAETGLLSLSCGTVSTPVIPPALVADIAGGAYPALVNILLALIERDRTGTGRHIDISMTDNLFPFLYWALAQGLGTGNWPQNGAERITGGSPRYRLYATLDGKFLAAAPLEDRFWHNFCDLIGLEGEMRRPDANPVEVSTRVEKIIRSKTASEWMEKLGTSDTCCAIVATVEEALQHPHFRARGLWERRVTGPNEHQSSALPLPLDNAFRNTENLGSAPALGADNDFYLKH
jgi:crotonobetainyl-CoA:carnitine CoA-transferase CaiB-like acyl-CoA transferase